MMETGRSRPRILVVGSLVMDLIVSMSRFPERGETVLGEGFQTACGGKGANQALQAARLGADVTMVGRIGVDDFGKRLKQSLLEAGVDVQHVIETHGYPSAIGNIQLENSLSGTDNRICVVSGANMALTCEDVHFLQEEMPQFDLVILQFEIPMEVNACVARYAREAGVPVMLNTAPAAQVDDQLISCATYLSPNEHEAELMTGVRVSTMDDAEKAADVLLCRGAKNVIITCGAKGAFFKNGAEKWISPSVFCDKVVDTTAAGDSFVGAFCVAVCKGMPHKEALKFGNCAAHVTISRMGAQPSLPTLNEVSALYRNASSFEEKDRKVEECV